MLPNAPPLLTSSPKGESLSIFHEASLTPVSHPKRCREESRRGAVKFRKFKKSENLRTSGSLCLEDAKDAQAEALRAVWEI